MGINNDDIAGKILVKYQTPSLLCAAHLRVMIGGDDRSLVS